MTTEELKKKIDLKKQAVAKLEVYQMTKGTTIYGKDVNQCIVALRREIKQHEYDLEHTDVLSNEEIRALARGETYMTDEEKKKQEQDRKFFRSVLGLPDEDEVRKFREMFKEG